MREPGITLHGVIRFCERVAGLPLDRVRAEEPDTCRDEKMAGWLQRHGVDTIRLAEQIVDDDMRAALAAGVTAIKRDGFTYIANARGQIVTILEPGQRPKRKARYRAHERRMEGTA